MQTKLSHFIFTATLLSAIGITSTSAYAQLTCTKSSPTTSQKSPYETGSPFISVLDNVREIQFPKSTTICMLNADIKAKKILANHWYMNSSKHMVFDIRNGVKSNRVELRGYDFAGNSRNKKWNGTYRLPSNTRSEGFTIGQILSVNNSIPILRLEVIKERRADGQVYTNHLFAIWRPAGSSSSVFNSLGPVAAVGSSGAISIVYGNTSAKITVSHTVGTTTKTAEMALGGWDTSTDRAYYKAGCYLQDPGDCRVTYTALSFDK